MNIILTGASRGIGYQTALKLCEYQIDRLALISRNEGALGNLKEECKKINNLVDIQIIATDLNSLTTSGNKISDIINWEKCDILINNAGALVNKPYLELLEDDMAKMFDVNLFSPARLIQQCLPMLTNAESAHVLNISSMGGYQGSSKFPGLSLYSSSKAALASLTECLAEEFKATSVRFNCLALGAVQTEMLNEAFPGYQAPLGAPDMGEHVAEFAMNGHKYYNGKVLPVTMSNP